MNISDRIRVRTSACFPTIIYVLKEHHVRIPAAPTANGRRNTARPMNRGNGATLLPYNLANAPWCWSSSSAIRPMSTGYDDLMIEAAAGLLDNASPENRIRAEAEEETATGSARSKKCSRPS